MTTKLKLTLAVLCAGALAAPLAMAQTAPSAPAAAAPAAAKEFVAEAPNVPQLNKPQITPLNQCAQGTFPNCTVPEPGSLPLIAVAALAAYAVMRRKKK